MAVWYPLEFPLSNSVIAPDVKKSEKESSISHQFYTCVCPQKIHDISGSRAVQVKQQVVVSENLCLMSSETKTDFSSWVSDIGHFGGGRGLFRVYA